MTDLITEARELIEDLHDGRRKPERIDYCAYEKLVALCDALEKAEERGQGCEHCQGWDTRSGAQYCPMCGKKLPVYAGTIGGEIVQHALKELGAEASRWIPVTERLPEDGNDVLVIASGKPWDNLNLDGAYEFASYLKNDGGWFFDAYPDWETPTITHWMPLPAPPEKEEGI